MGSWLVWILLDVLIKLSVSILRKIRLHYRPYVPKYTVEQLIPFFTTQKLTLVLHEGKWGHKTRKTRYRNDIGVDGSVLNLMGNQKPFLWSFSLWKDWLSAPSNISIFFKYSHLQCFLLEKVKKTYLITRHWRPLFSLKQRNLNDLVKIF